MIRYFIHYNTKFSDSDSETYGLGAVCQDWVGVVMKTWRHYCYTKIRYWIAR